MSRRRAKPPHWRKQKQALGSPDGLDVFLFLMSLQHWEALHADDPVAAYRDARDRLPAGVGTRTTLFWAYEEGIPAELRGTGSIADVENQDLTRARVSWLLRDGSKYLRPGERERIGHAYAAWFAKGLTHGR